MPNTQTAWYYSQLSKTMVNHVWEQTQIASRIGTESMWRKESSRQDAEGKTGRGPVKKGLYILRVPLERGLFHTARDLNNVVDTEGEDTWWNSERRRYLCG